MSVAHSWPLSTIDAARQDSQPSGVGRSRPPPLQGTSGICEPASAAAAARCVDQGQSPCEPDRTKRWAEQHQAVLAILLGRLVQQALVPEPAGIGGQLPGDGKPHRLQDRPGRRVRTQVGQPQRAQRLHRQELTLGDDRQRQADGLAARERLVDRRLGRFGEVAGRLAGQIEPARQRARWRQLQRADHDGAGPGPGALDSVEGEGRRQDRLGNVLQRRELHRGGSVALLGRQREHTLGLPLLDGLPRRESLQRTVRRLQERQQRPALLRPERRRETGQSRPHPGLELPARHPKAPLGLGQADGAPLGNPGIDGDATRADERAGLVGRDDVRRFEAALPARQTVGQQGTGLGRRRIVGRRWQGPATSCTRTGRSSSGGCRCLHVQPSRVRKPC